MLSTVTKRIWLLVREFSVSTMTTRTQLLVLLPTFSPCWELSMCNNDHKDMATAAYSYLWSLTGVVYLSATTTKTWLLSTTAYFWSLTGVVYLSAMITKTWLLSTTAYFWSFLGVVYLSAMTTKTWLLLLTSSASWELSVCQQ